VDQQGRGAVFQADPAFDSREKVRNHGIFSGRRSVSGKPQTAKVPAGKAVLSALPAHLQSDEEQKGRRDHEVPEVQAQSRQ
jgi:hypothetical protein